MQPALACIATTKDGASIALHPILNHPDTPQEVVAFILRHELLHMLVPPRVVAGKLKMHPPEFWDEEKKMCPDRRLYWTWLKVSFGYVSTKAAWDVTIT
jgi:predicted metal-dependent hydrolase